MNEIINEQREQIAQLTAERDALTTQLRLCKVAMTEDEFQQVEKGMSEIGKPSCWTEVGVSSAEFINGAEWMYGLFNVCRHRVETRYDKKLKDERDALTAQVEALKLAGAEALKYLIYPAKRSSGAQASYDKLSEALESTPQQHLAEVRAQAVSQCVAIVDQTKTTVQASSRYWKSGDITPDKFKENAIVNLKRHLDSIRRGEVK